MDNWKDLAEMAAFGLGGIFFTASLIATSFLYRLGESGTDLLVILAGSLAGLILCVVHVTDIYSKIKRK
jgi:hypothetical protein